MRPKHFILAISLMLSSLCSLAQNSEPNNKPRLSGRVLINSEVFTSHRDSFPDVLKFADVRIGIKGTIDDSWYYKIDVSYAESRVTAKDVFFGYRKANHQLQIGQFYEPYSVGYLASSVDAEFQQVPSSLYAFGNSRKLGFSYVYNTKKYNFTFASFTQNSVESIAKPLGTYTINSRFIYRPLYEDNRLIHLAIAPAWRKLDGKVGYSSPGFQSSNIQKLADVQLDDANSQLRVGLESCAVINRFAAKAEYVFTRAFRDNHGSFYGNGGYMEFSYVPIGTQYNYDSSWGCLYRPSKRSLEFVARYNYLDLNDGKAGVYGGSHHDFQIGANFYITNNVAVKCSYNHLMPLSDLNVIQSSILSSFQFRVQFVL